MDQRPRLVIGIAALISAGCPDRFAPPGGSAGGTVVDDGSLRDIAICVPPNGGQALVSRDLEKAVYLFRCVAFRESQQIRKDGALVSEIDLVVTTRSGALTDSFLSQTLKILYARLE